MDDRFASFREATAAALLEKPGDDGSRTSSGDCRREPSARAENAGSENPHPRLHGDGSGCRCAQRQVREDQLFEIIAAAVFGAASDRLAAARRALEEA